MATLSYDDSLKEQRAGLLSIGRNRQGEPKIKFLRARVENTRDAPDSLRNQQTLLPLLRYAVGALLLGPLITMLALGSVFPDALLNFIAPSVIFLLGLVSGYLIHRKRITAAIRLMAIGLWTAVTGIAFFTGGVQSPVVVVYPVIILMAGWLINVRAAMRIAALSVIAALGLWWLNSMHWPGAQLQPPTAVYAVHQVLVYILSAVLIATVLRAYLSRLHELRVTRDSLNVRTLAFRQSEARYRTLIEWSPEPMLVHRAGQILYVNPAALKLFGAPDAQSLLNKTTHELIHPDARALQASRMKSIYNHETIQPMVESRFLRLDGSAIDVEVQGTAIDYDGEPAIHVVIRDITERKQIENQVRRLAFYDALTQLPNRRLLNDRLSQAMAANRRSGNFGAVMFLDLDNFKPLNDRYGHTLGDLLLVEVAIRLKACVRETDTVARFGGDEFVLVIEDLAAERAESERLALTLAEKICTCLSELYTLEKSGAEGHLESVTHHCTTSIGVAMVWYSDASPDDLIKWADAAMYQAKNEGGNRIRFWDAKATDWATEHGNDDAS